MDAVIPVYEVDLCALQHVAHSIRTHGALINQIHLYWVSPRPMRDFRPQLERVRATLNVSRRVHLREAYFRQYRSGWQGQQVAKLMAAYHIHTEHYLLLDCKNILLRQLEMGDFIASGGQTYLGPCHKTFYGTWLASSWRALGVPKRMQRSIWPPQSITPFVMRTSTARDMMRIINVSTRATSVQQALTSVISIDPNIQAGATEFLLYSVYALVYESRY